ncbi:MAG TPA: restriction endonuclease subunit S [Candidatus Binatia bacterium]
MSKNSFEIPEDWAWTTMGDIADVVGGGTPKTNDPTNYDDGDIPWITPADLSGYTSKYIGRGARSITQKGLNSSSARMIPAGSVLFTSRAPVGYVAVATNDVCTNQGFKSFVLKTKNILPDYVYWWLKGNKDLAESYASGTTFLELSGAKAKQLPIPIAPLEQQTRIVAEIEKQFSRVDEAVANLNRVKANLKRYKAAVLKAAVEGKLTEEWRKAHPEVEPASEVLKRILAERRTKWNGKGKYKEPNIPRVSGAFDLPKGWAIACIEQLLPPQREAMKTGPFGSLLKKHEHRAEGVPVLGIENIEAMHFLRGSNIHVTSEKAKQLEQYRVKPLDILISRSGTISEICVVPEDIGEAIFSTNLMKISLVHKAIHPQFFTFLFNGSPFVLNQISELCKGSTRTFLNQDILKRLTFVLPPVEEQHEIIRALERQFTFIDRLYRQIETNLHRSEGLRQAIVRMSFSGALPANQQ